jgi:Protein of unknown function (DUF3108)
MGRREDGRKEIQGLSSPAWGWHRKLYRGAVAVWMMLFSCLLCGFDLPPPVSVSLPFQAGEELTFEVSRLGVSVGVATLSVGKQIHTDGRDILPLFSLAQSHPFFSTFYEVDDRVESHFDPRQLLSRYYRIQLKEGRYRMHGEVTLDPEQQRAAYSKNHQPAHLLPTTGAVQDPLSSLYMVRTMPLQVGDSVSLPIFDRGKIWLTEIRVLARERLQLPVGTVYTLKLQPLLRTAGIFRRTGELFVWLSDDAYRVPVQMQSRLTIGAVSARLLKVKGVALANAGAGEMSR